MNNTSKRFQTKWYSQEFSFIILAVGDGFLTNKSIVSEFLTKHPGRTEASILAAVRNFRKDGTVPITIVEDATDAEFERMLKTRTKRYESFVAAQSNGAEAMVSQDTESNTTESIELMEIEQIGDTVKLTLSFTGYTLTSVTKWALRNLNLDI